jgi:hypothetical protein
VTEPTPAPRRTAGAEQADLMASRYGSAPRSRRLLTLGAVVVVAAALLAWLLWAAWRQSTGTVDGSVSAFDIIGPHRIDVTLEIRRPAHTAVRCTLQAQATDHSVVGQTVVSLSPAGSSDVTVRTSVRTEREATTAVVSDCR